MRLPITVEVSTAFKSICCLPALILLILLFPTNCDAQRKWSLDVNANVFLPVGQDAINLYYLAQPISVEYYTKKKFNNLYFAVLPNINYSITSKLLIGLQSGVYIHFNEQFSGYRKPVLITFPILGTGRIAITKIKNNNLGINVSAGKNFFRMDTYPYDIKNGWLFNGSIFYQANKSIFKIGIEQQNDKGYYYYTSNSQLTKDQTIQKDLKRTAVTVSYGYIIKY